MATVIIRGDEYTRHGDVLLCEQYDCDVVLTPYDGEWEVHVHVRELDDKGQPHAAVCAGPWRSRSRDLTAAWGVARAGLRLHRRYTVAGTDTAVTFPEVTKDMDTRLRYAVGALGLGDAADVGGRQIVRVQ